MEEVAPPAGIQQQHRQAGLCQLLGGKSAGSPGADHDGIEPPRIMYSLVGGRGDGRRELGIFWHESHVRMWVYARLPFGRARRCDLCT